MASSWVLLAKKHCPRWFSRTHRSDVALNLKCLFSCAKTTTFTVPTTLDNQYLHICICTRRPVVCVPQLSMCPEDRDGGGLQPQPLGPIQHRLRASQPQLRFIQPQYVPTSRIWDWHRSDIQDVVKIFTFLSSWLSFKLPNIWILEDRSDNKFFLCFNFALLHLGLLWWYRDLFQYLP